MSYVYWMALGGVAFLALRRFAFGYSRPDEHYQYLARREVHFLNAIAEATFPAGGAIPISGLDADLPRYIDEYLVRLPAKLRREIRLLIGLFEQATLVFPATGRGGFRRFSSLTQEQRVCVLRNWSESQFYLRRVLFTALRALITFGYFADKRVNCYLRVAPLAIDAPICEADLLYPAVGRHPDTIPYTDADLTPPSDGSPLDPDGPLHPDYAEVRW